MLWRLFVEDAESRVAFPRGVAALYRALHAGPAATRATRCSTSPAPLGALRHAVRAFPSVTASRRGRCCPAGMGPPGRTRCRAGRPTTSRR
ncbi:hypothetical protein ACRAWF_10525 [Streptomyces sp. L7]